MSPEKQAQLFELYGVPCPVFEEPISSITRPDLLVVTPNISVFSTFKDQDKQPRSKTDLTATSSSTYNGFQVHFEGFKVAE